MTRRIKCRPRSRGVLLAALVVLALLGGSAVAAGPGPGAAAPAAAQAQCTAPAWDAGAIYDAGAVVSHNGHQWQASHWMWPGVQPGVDEAPPWWVPWTDLGACGSGTTTTTTQPPGSTTTTTPGSTTTTVPPSGNVEEHFLAPGPWAATTGTASAPGTPGVMLAYPTDLGADGYDHPIVTWGNGTIDAPNPCQLTEQNGGILTHLASWGFVVVCANTGNSGSGSEIWAAAQWMMEQDTNPSSVFSGKLDTTSIGAMGGSQGAAGVVHANILSNGVIDSILAWAFVDPIWHFWGQLPDFNQVQGPIFFASGTSDFLATQTWQQNFYNEVSGPAAKAALDGVGHDPAARERGYATAWFKYTLEGDSFARSAFVATGGNPPQISADPDWTNWAGKSLP